MKRGGMWLAAMMLLASAGLPARGQDNARAQQLVSQIERRAKDFWPDARVGPGRAALFRGELSDVGAALEELAGMGEPAILFLGRLLQSPQAHLRANAADALSQVGGPKTVGPLMGALKDRSDGVRYQVAQALGYTASAAALVALNELAGDEDGAVRNAAVQVGGVLREILIAEQSPTAEARVAALIKLSQNDPARSRIAAYGEAAVPGLVQALDAADRGIVSGSAECLARIGSPAGLEPLYKHFEASLAATPETKFALALAQYRSAEVWPYLLKLLALEQDLPAVRAAQYYAVHRLGSFEHPDRLKALNDFLARQIAAGAHKTVIRGPDLDVSPVAAVCEVLAKVGDQSSLKLLDQLINEAPPPEKSIVKQLAQNAKAAIEKRSA